MSLPAKANGYERQTSKQLTDATAKKREGRACTHGSLLLVHKGGQPDQRKDNRSRLPLYSHHHRGEIAALGNHFRETRNVPEEKPITMGGNGDYSC